MILFQLHPPAYSASIHKLWGWGSHPHNIIISHLLHYLELHFSLFLVLGCIQTCQYAQAAQEYYTLVKPLLLLQGKLMNCDSRHCQSCPLEKCLQCFVLSGCLYELAQAVSFLMTAVLYWKHGQTGVQRNIQGSGANLKQKRWEQTKLEEKMGIQHLIYLAISTDERHNQSRV